jgi:hypothetical protein
MEESGVFSVNMEGSFCMGQGGVFFSEKGRDFLYGARWCFFQRIWKVFFVWGKVVFFSGNMEGIFCMGQGGVFSSENGREFLYGAK